MIRAFCAAWLIWCSGLVGFKHPGITFFSFEELSFCEEGRPMSLLAPFECVNDPPRGEEGDLVFGEVWPRKRCGSYDVTRFSWENNVPDAGERFFAGGFGSIKFRNGGGTHSGKNLEIDYCRLDGWGLATITNFDRYVDIIALSRGIPFDTIRQYLRLRLNPRTLIDIEKFSRQIQLSPQKNNAAARNKKANPAHYYSASCPSSHGLLRGKIGYLALGFILSIGAVSWALRGNELKHEWLRAFGLLAGIGFGAVFLLGLIEALL